MKIVRLKKLATGTTGSEIAEAALVLPIFFLIMLGIYWFGRAFNTYATINHAAREGARLAVAQTCAACGNAQPSLTAIGTQVAQALQASSLVPGQVTNAGEPATRAACGGGTSSCQTPGAGPQICVYYNVQLQPAASLSAGSGAPGCGVSVQFQYPYQFYLPFTSLNMQQVMLNAGVQMTAEY
jgi:Flp pilus assembly protein TadG